MVRIIQPAGKSGAPLVRIGLLEDVEEVILLCSPESMNDEEFERIQSVAKELGSKAKYTREIIPILGVTVTEILDRLTEVKEKINYGRSDAKMHPTNFLKKIINLRTKIFNKKISTGNKTLVSTNGSTLLFGNCILSVFSECETLTMNWKDSTYFLSRGVTKKMAPMSEDFVWKIFGLQHRIEKGKSQILSDGRIIAQPSSVSLRGEKIYFEWDNEPSDNYDAAMGAKIIASEMRALCRINAPTKYDFVVKGSTKFDYFDRYTINTNKPVQPNSMFKPASNEFFSTIQMPKFPHGKAASNTSCLHIIVNERDITPTAFSIMLHKPDHVVLWVLNTAMNNQKRAEFEGKITVLVHYLTGEIIPKLKDAIKPVGSGKASEFLEQNPPPKMDIEFHMVSLQELGDSQVILPQIPPVEKILVELNSGFLGLQDQMMKTLSNANTDFERWITDSNKFEAVRISDLGGKIKGENHPNLSRLLLRKRIPFGGTILSNKEDYLRKLGIVLPILLKNKRFENGLWRPKGGLFVNENGNNIEVKGKKFSPSSKAIASNSYFEVKLDNEEDFLTFGESNHMVGIWLEELAAYLIHFYWKSHFSVYGMDSKLIAGNWMLGASDDVDIYCITDFGEVIGEAKAFSRLDSSKISPIIGQLSGETFVVGTRHGQIPMLVIATDSSPFDEIANREGVVICSWWELQYPERIMHRFKTGKRSEEELAEIAALNAKIGKIIEDDDAKETKKSTEKSSKNRKGLKRPTFVHPLFWKYMPDQASFLEKPIEEQKRLSNENKEEHRKNKVTSPEVQQNTLFTGTVNLEQFTLLEDGPKNTISISGVEELKETVIAIAKRKYKTLFGGDSNTVQEREEANGYDIRVVDISLKPESISAAENATAYLFNCNPILSEDEKEDS
jgi:hypothetical protein